MNSNFSSTNNRGNPEAGHCRNSFARSILKGPKMDPKCVNLREMFGQRFKIGWDPAYDPKGIHEKDPWMMTLPCQKGVIYPQGGEMLAVEIDNRPITAKQVAAIPGIVCHQDGDHEKTFLFHVDLFDQVAEMVKPRKRRRLSDGQMAKCIDRLAKHRPRPLPQSDGKPLERVRPA
jgi:hypothetical protein